MLATNWTAQEATFKVTVRKYSGQNGRFLIHIVTCDLAAFTAGSGPKSRSDDMTAGLSPEFGSIHGGFQARNYVASTAGLGPEFSRRRAQDRN